MELDLSNVISITIQGTPSGLSEKNVNSLALFSTEKPGNVDPYGIYLNAKSVAEDYGTDSVAYDMATAIFSQAPNILTGNGRLVIIPFLDAVSATSGNFATADISANLASLKAVSSGDIRVTLNGTNIDLTDLDFTNCTTLADIAEILQASLTNAIVTATSTAITITSKKVGADADVVLAQLPAGSGADLSAAGYFNVSSGTATSGTDSSGETLEEAITRTEELVSYVGVITDLEMEDDVLEDLADAIQAKDMMLIHHCCSTEDIAGIATTVSDASDNKTRLLLYTEGLTDANLMKAAYAGRGFSVNFSGTDTSSTMNLKSLATINADTGISQTTYTNALEAGMDMYVSYRGVASVASSGGNLYFDQVYSRLALKFALETAGFNYLRQTNTKVPQTEKGMDGLKGAYNKQMERFVRNGYIGRGLTWNSSETFGDPETFKSNITEKGYYTYSIPIADQEQAEREERIAPVCQIAVKEAGAIHKSNVIVTIEA